MPSDFRCLFIQFGISLWIRRRRRKKLDSSTFLKNYFVWWPNISLCHTIACSEIICFVTHANKTMFTNMRLPTANLWVVDFWSLSKQFLQKCFSTLYHTRMQGNASAQRLKSAFWNWKIACKMTFRRWHRILCDLEILSMHFNFVENKITNSNQILLWQSWLYRRYVCVERRKDIFRFKHLLDCT